MSTLGTVHYREVDICIGDGFNTAEPFYEIYLAPDYCDS